MTRHYRNKGLLKTLGKKLYTHAKSGVVGALAGFGAHQAVKHFVPNPMSQHKHKLSQKVKGAINGTSQSISGFMHRKIKRKDAIALRPLGKQNYVTNESARLSNTVGEQEFNLIATIYSNTLLSQIYTNIATSAVYGTNSVKTLKIFLNSVTVETLITNQTNATARLILYDIVCRRDTDNSTLLNPSYVLKNTMVDVANEAGSIGTNTNYQTIGFSPFTCKAFTTFYKVRKVTYLDLPAGQNHVHRTTCHPSRWINDELIRYTANGIKNLTGYTVIQQHGYPDDYSGGTSTVVTGSTSIDYVTKYSYTYQYAVRAINSYMQGNNIGTTGTGNEQTMEQATGAPATVTTA